MSVPSPSTSQPDGFESFCVSQYFPDNYNILVGRDSRFVCQWNYTTLVTGRRSGMPAEYLYHRGLFHKQADIYGKVPQTE